MRNVVIQDEFGEKDIRPGIETTEYLSLVAKDAQFFFDGNLAAVDCPACSSSAYNTVFGRFGFDYVECAQCGTVFMNPRPPQEIVDNYYKQSNASKFWFQQFLKVSDVSRKEHICIPRLNWVSGTVKKHKIETKRYADVYSKYLEMLRHIQDWLAFDEGYVYRPMIDENIATGFKIITELPRQDSLGINVATMFEVIERVSSPEIIIKELRDNFAFDALLFLTTSTIDGLEHQVLWDKSKNIFPPDHMTLFSIEGLTQILKRNNFEIVELSTPGILDVDIVKNEFVKGGDFKTHRFLTKILDSDNHELKADFQSFLQRNRLSSHIRIVCQAK